MRPLPRLDAVRIEALEPRIAPSALALLDRSTAVYSDDGGDKVTIKFSKPILTADNLDAIVAVAPGAAGDQITIDFAAITAANKSAAGGVSLTIVTVPGDHPPTLWIIDSSSPNLSESIKAGGSLDYSSVSGHNTGLSGGSISNVNFSLTPPVAVFDPSSVLQHLIAPTFLTNLLNESPTPFEPPTPAVTTVSLGHSSPFPVESAGAGGAVVFDLTTTEAKFGGAIQEALAASVQISPDFGAAPVIAFATGTLASVANLTGVAAAPIAHSKTAAVEPAPTGATAPTAGDDLFAGVDRIGSSGSALDSHVDLLSGQPAPRINPVLLGEAMMGGYEPNPISLPVNRTMFDAAFLGSLLGGLDED